MRRSFAGIAAYVAAVLIGAAVTAAGFSLLVGGFVGWRFVLLTTAGVFLLSLPFSLIAVALRRTRPTRLGGAIGVGVLNGLVSSFLLYALAPIIAQAIMMIAGACGGAMFYGVERRLGRERVPPAL